MLRLESSGGAGFGGVGVDGFFRFLFLRLLFDLGFDAKGFGLSVSDRMPEEFMKLMTLYPQPLKRQPTVEYLPIPRHSSDYDSRR